MKVLFVCSGNNHEKASPVIINQAESLQKFDIQLYYYTLKGKGIIGYLKNIFTLRDYIKSNNFDIIHAHYLFSAVVATFAGVKPLVVSLMGSDLYENILYKFVIKILCRYKWYITIVKSKSMKKRINYSQVFILPNGVDLKRFIPMDKVFCQNMIGWDKGKKHILFPAYPYRPEKNFQLSKKAIRLLDQNKFELHYLQNTPNKSMPALYNASDVILLTSYFEGSPNVIKEALACNRPIVSTDVGDVQERVKGIKGCFITEYNALEISKNILEAIKFTGINGRKNVQHLDSQIVSDKLISMYNNLLMNNRTNC